jgi:hypothetical protein
LGSASASCRPLDQLHRQKELPVGLLDGVDRDDVGMIERGNGLRFARFVDFSHAARPERAEDLVGPDVCAGRQHLDLVAGANAAGNYTGGGPGAR